MSTLPKLNEPFEFFDSLTNQITGEFQLDPTIEAGDFQISKDGGAFVNLTNLPVVAPAGSDTVQFNLTAAETDKPNIAVRGIDQNDAEWSDIRFYIPFPTGNAETASDILEGDHIETSVRLIVNKKGTTETILDKKVGGSLLPPQVEITTTEPVTT